MLWFVVGLVRSGIYKNSTYRSQEEGQSQSRSDPGPGPCNFSSQPNWRRTEFLSSMHGHHGHGGRGTPQDPVRCLISSYRNLIEVLRPFFGGTPVKARALCGILLFQKRSKSVSSASQKNFLVQTSAKPTQGVWGHAPSKTTSLAELPLLVLFGKRTIN
jgi:hypothetical protein